MLRRELKQNLYEKKCLEKGGLKKEKNPKRQLRGRGNTRKAGQILPQMGSDCYCSIVLYCESILWFGLLLFSIVSRWLLNEFSLFWIVCDHEERINDTFILVNINNCFLFCYHAITIQDIGIKIEHKFLVTGCFIAIYSDKFPFNCFGVDRLFCCVITQIFLIRNGFVFVYFFY